MFILGILYKVLYVELMNTKTYCNYLLNTSDLNNNYSISTGNNVMLSFCVNFSTIYGTYR